MAAIDIAFLGSKLIVIEFAVGVILPAALGCFILLRAGPNGSVLLGLYFIALGLNYLPLLVNAVALTRDRSALTELGHELNDKRRTMAKYRRQSLWLLVPLVTPVVALIEWRRKAQSRHS